MPVLGYEKLLALKDELFEGNSYDLSGFQLASYELRAGDCEILADGDYYIAYEKSIITLPPHQIAFLSTQEIVHLPHNILGKIVLRFEYASKGLLLLGGHVDPLFEGRLYLIVDNLSDRPIVIKPGERIAILNLFEVDHLQEISDIEKAKFKKVFRTIPASVIEDWQGRHMVEIYRTIEDYRDKIEDLQRQVNSISATSRYVLIGGVVLIASSILGVVLQTVFASWNSAINIGQIMPRPVNTPSVLALLCMPVLTVILFMVFMLVALGVIRSSSNKW